jgi:hypothetical protein
MFGKPPGPVFFPFPANFGGPGVMSRPRYFTIYHNYPGKANSRRPAGTGKDKQKNQQDLS